MYMDIHEHAYADNFVDHAADNHNGHDQRKEQHTQMHAKGVKRKKTHRTRKVNSNMQARESNANYRYTLYYSELSAIPEQQSRNNMHSDTRRETIRTSR